MTIYRVETDATISVYYSKISTYDISVTSEYSNHREEERLKEVLEFITDKFPELEVEIEGLETTYERVEQVYSDDLL